MKTLTLDEQKANQKKKGPKFNLRKAGESSDIDLKWKKATIRKKENEGKSDEEEQVSTEECLVFLTWIFVMIKIGTTESMRDTNISRY